MTKEQKEKYIEAVNNRFINARNHGYNGGNWWYPKENTIAYNVKMYSAGVSIDDIRKKLTKRQNEYYKNDEFFSNLVQEYIEQEANMFSDSLDEEKGIVKSGYAGRSAGWLEVEYKNEIDNWEEINDRYTEAKKLEALESKIEARIMEAKASLEKYIGSKEFLEYITKEAVLDDTSIANVYKGKTKDLLDKLK